MDCENVKLIFICTPNNPTGNLLERQHLIELLEHYKDKSIIVIDEAYIEFCPEFACEQLISDYPNLAVIRTLSKAFGLAALRCGFLLAGRDIIDIVHRVMAPYPLAEPITQIARQALTNSGLRRMEQSVERITNASNKFCEELAKLDCVTEVIPGLGNFVLVKFKDASVDLSLLLKNGINIRDVVTGFGITHLHKRISIGTDEQMELLMTVLEKINANYVSKVSPAIADEVSFG